MPSPGDLAWPIAPMRAVSGELPRDEGWAFEVKWDGMRVLAFVDGGAVRLQTANLADATVRFPELGALAEAVAAPAAVLDGEVVALDASGAPSFGLLQQRMHVDERTEARRRAATAPVSYVAFDVLAVGHADVTAETYLQRRARLADVLGDGDHWSVPAHHLGDGEVLLQATVTRGLEGLVAKRADSRYEIGRRSPAWRKVKNRRRQEVVVGGWLPGAGNRAGHLGALLVGYHDAAGRFVYAGRVGTGFSGRELDRLAGLLAPLARADPPFSTPLPPPVRRQGRWVEPRLVAEVAFGEWTGDGVLRHPSYLGLRSDKDPRDVVREPG